jgi:hypothetical protein
LKTDLENEIAWLLFYLVLSAKDPKNKDKSVAALFKAYSLNPG